MREVQRTKTQKIRKKWKKIRIEIGSLDSAGEGQKQKKIKRDELPFDFLRLLFFSPQTWAQNNILFLPESSSRYIWRHTNSLLHFRSYMFAEIFRHINEQRLLITWLVRSSRFTNNTEVRMRARGWGIFKLRPEIGKLRPKPHPAAIRVLKLRP